MIVANSAGQCKMDPAIEAWIHEEGPTMAADILDRMPPAIRQAMTTLDVMESGMQALMMAIGRGVGKNSGIRTPLSQWVAISTHCGVATIVRWTPSDPTHCLVTKKMGWTTGVNSLRSNPPVNAS